MNLNDVKGDRPSGLLLAGGYAALMAILIVLGLLGSVFGDDGDYPGNAVKMPLASLLIAAGLGGAAYGLYRRDNRARFLFLVIAPWGALALASVFARMFWQDDIPWTHFLFFIYAPLAFLLSRPHVLEALGAKSDNWISRGAALLLACAVVMLLARLGVMAAKPSGGGGFYGQLVSMNAYVQRLVLCLVPFWHYLWGFVAVSIPIAIRMLGRRNAGGDS